VTARPDIAWFGQDGTWVKPAGAVRVDVFLAGGDGGDRIGDAGGEGGGASSVYPSLIPADVAHAPSAEHRRGHLGVMSYDAGTLPDRLQVTVGKGGRPGGLDGYVLIVTRLAGTARTMEAGHASTMLAGTCATCGKPVPGGGHTEECTGLVPGSEYLIGGGGGGFHGGSGGPTMFSPLPPGSSGGSAGATGYASVPPGGGGSAGGEPAAGAAGPAAMAAPEGIVRGWLLGRLTRGHGCKCLLVWDEEPTGRMAWHLLQHRRGTFRKGTR
jgi:hypothetical protein